MERINSQKGIDQIPYPKQLLLILLRSFFKLLYHQFAWSYDTVAWLVSLGNWQKWVRSVVPYLEGTRVLEIGFGPGHLQLAMAQKGIAGFGLDESCQMAQQARNRLVRHSIRPLLLRGEAENLPFANNSFNQVVMTFPSEYILKSATMEEIKRVLMSGGTAVVVPLAWITGRMPWEKLVAWVNYITGEAPVWNPKVLEPLKDVGFEVNWEMIDFPNSKIVVIRLIKK